MANLPAPPDAVLADVQASAAKYGVDPSVMLAQLQAESNFQQYAGNVSGAYGIAQFEPQTASQYGLYDRTNIAASIDAQAHYLSDLLSKNGNYPAAIGSYYAGNYATPNAVPPGNVLTPYQYQQNILTNAQVYAQAIGDANVSTTNGDNSLTRFNDPMSGVNAGVSGLKATFGADPFGVNTAIDKVNADANDLATKIFLGSFAIALIALGGAWLAAGNPTVQSAAKVGATA